MKKVFACILMFITIASYAQNQANSKLIAIASPNASSLGQYGTIPIGYFNGLPNINIPIYTIKDGAVDLPIQLSYHASGVRPDNHPGWVGLGWSLQAGGVVTRIVNGETDEKLIDASSYTYPTSQSYLDHFDMLADKPNDTWSSQSSLATIYDNVVNQLNVPVRALPMPDEFVFNFNGYSGSFFLDHTGVWKAKVVDNKSFKIDVQTKNDFQLVSDGDPAHYVTLKRIIYKIIMTTPEGVVYTFGGDPTAVEFNRGVSSQRQELTYSNIIASSFYLKQIQYPNGDNVYFTYEKEQPVIILKDSWQNTTETQNFKFAFANVVNGSTSSGSGGGRAPTLVNPVYLSSITTPTCKVDFERGLSKELQFQDVNISQGYPDLQYMPSDYTAKKWFQLNKIKINSYSKLKEFEFKYTDDLNKRLMLMSLNEISNDGNNKLTHNFTYDQTQLPGYLSRKLDHWGFFNDINYFAGQPGNKQYTVNDLDVYTASRNPNPNVMQAGILKSIQYPTGGKVIFEYEPHDYSGVIKKDLNSGVQYSAVSTTIAGGLRIRSITNVFDQNNVIKRAFTYKKTNGTQSSGILGGLPVYYRKIQAQGPNNTQTEITNFSNYSAEPLTYTNGSHVTYSEVQERLNDGSYKNYVYSNHDVVDSKYLDKNIIASANFLASPGMSMDHERGFLLKEAAYDVDGKIVQDIVYKYNEDPNRLNNNIRVVDIELMTDNSGQIIFAPLYAYVRYLNIPYILKKTQTNYYPAGGTKTISSNIDYKYESAYHTFLTAQEESVSEGKIKGTAFIYPQDYKIGTAFIDNMRSFNLLKYPLETIHYQSKDGQTSIVAGELTAYRATGKLLIDKKQIIESKLPITLNNFKFSNATIGSMPYTSTGSDYSQDTRYKDRLIYNSYSSRNQPSTVTYSNGSNMTYVWGYNYLHPIAEVTNALSNEIYLENFEESTASGVSVDANSHSGDKLFLGQTYSVNWTAPSSKKFVITYWYRVKGQWLYAKPTTYGGTSFNLNNSDAEAYDDIIISPVGAQVKAYTYIPLVGMSSSMDEGGRLQIYNYDQFNRLEFVRDKDKNIVKRFQYNYNFIDHINSTANWQNTSQQSCAVDKYNNNTGERLQQQVDLNPFSSSYNTIKYISLGTNTTSCPIPAAASYTITDKTTDSSLRYVTITVTKSYDDNVRAICKVRIDYDTAQGGQQASMLQNIQFEQGETSKTVTFDVNAASSIEVVIDSIIPN